MSLALIITDLLSVFFAFYSAYYLRIRSGLFSHSPVSFSLYTGLILLTLFLTLTVFLNFQQYKLKRGYFSPLEFFSLVRAYIFVFIIVLAITFLAKGFIFSRMIIFFAFFFSILFTSLFRWIYRRSVRKSKKRVVIIGNTALAKRLEKKILSRPELGYLFVKTLSSFHEFQKYTSDVDIVFLAMHQRPQNLLDIIERYEYITFKIASDYIDLMVGPANFDEFSDIPLIELKDKESHKLYIFFKRLLDILASFILLILLLPFFIVLALFIKLTSRGSILISQERVGYKEQPFSFYKFRTMYSHSQRNYSLNNEVEYLFKKQHDPRVTPLGRLFRRFCLDELPQLYNVLKGDMSLVGPRPHFASETRHLQGVQRKRFLVRPGMTGLWQISGRHDLSFDRTVYLDIYYVKHSSFLLDLEILLKTLPAILFSKGFW